MPLASPNYWNVFFSTTSETSFCIVHLIFIFHVTSVGSRYSTFAVNIFKHTAKLDGKAVDIEFWDTGLSIDTTSGFHNTCYFILAGQEKFDNIHHSYFHQAHACIMVCISIIFGDYD